MGVTLKTFLIASIMVSMFALGIYGFKTELANNYGVPDNSFLTQNEESFTTLLNSSSGIGTSMSERTEQSGGLRVTSGVIEIASDVYSIIKLPFQLTGIINDLLTDVVSQLGFPTYFVQGIYAMILIIIALIVISLVFRRDA